MLSTGRDLDVAVNGDGWIAVQGPDGKEAYTRAGDLKVDPTGQLMTATGQPVLSDGGAPINIPPYTSIFFARDGSISVVAQDRSRRPIDAAVVATHQVLEQRRLSA